MPSRKSLVKYAFFQVSWIRKSSSPPDILTVGLAPYIADDRFSVEHARHLQNWDLIIKQVRSSDEGLYECQVTTHPPASIFIKLRVTGEPYYRLKKYVMSPSLHTLMLSVDFFLLWKYSGRFCSFFIHDLLSYSGDELFAVLVLWTV